MSEGQGHERRKSRRIKCRFSCDVEYGNGKRTSGTVVDVSEGGLAIRVAQSAQHGEPAFVHMTAPGFGDFDIEALVWHVRRARKRETGEIIHLLGLMLSKAPEGYFALTSGERPGQRRESAAETPPDTRPEPRPEPPVVRDPGPDKPLLVPFRIRIKHRTSPRTRVVTIDAASQQEATAIAREELGLEWEVLESRGGERVS